MAKPPVFNETNLAPELVSLPPEVLFIIFNFLPLATVASVGQANNRLKKIVDDYLNRELQIKEIACGYNYSLILFAHGRVFAMGSNNQRQLGFPVKGSQFVPQEIVDIERMTHISTGYSHTLMLSKSNNLWAMGANKDAQLSFINQGDQPIELQKLSSSTKIQAAVTVDFTSAYIVNETIHSYGHKGLKPHLINGELKLLPDWVKIPDNLSIADISVGEQHALVLTNEGEVYGIGSNEKGLLGLDSKTQCYEDWTILPIREVSKIKATALGSLLLTTSNELMVSGTNTKGQFKQSSSYFVTLATGVKTFDANSYHTLYVDNANQLHALGSNEEGQLGLSKLNSEGKPEPTMLQIVDENVPTPSPTPPQQQSIMSDLQSLTCFNTIFKKPIPTEKAPATPDWDDETNLTF